MKPELNPSKIQLRFCIVVSLEVFGVFGEGEVHGNFGGLVLLDFHVFDFAVIPGFCRCGFGNLRRGCRDSVGADQYVNRPDYFLNRSGWDEAAFRDNCYGVVREVYVVALRIVLNEVDDELAFVGRNFWFI